MWLVWAAAPTPDSETIQRAGLIHTLRMRCFSLHYRAIGPSLLVTQTTGDDRFLSSSRFVFFFCYCVLQWSRHIVGLGSVNTTSEKNAIDSYTR